MLTIALIVAPGKYDFRERRTVIESQLSSKLINKKETLKVYRFCNLIYWDVQWFRNGKGVKKEAWRQ